MAGMVQPEDEGKESGLKIFTFYSPLNYRPPEDDYRLLQLWQYEWKAIGLDPVVLNEWWARKHPDYEKFNAIVSRFPTINPPEYDRACLIRWLAYAVVGGGIACDYDLFCYDYKAIPDEPQDRLQMAQLHVPSLVMGTKLAFEQVVQGIMKYQVDVKDVNEFGKPHVSDMHIFLKGNLPVDQHHIVRNYGEEGWLEAPFTHFSSGSMQAAGKLPKWKYIPLLREVK